MKKSYLKVILREIKQSFGRFAAIFAIVLLGVGFLFGLISTTPNMRSSVDTYYDESNVYDINLKSTLGFNEDDIDAISDNEAIEDMMAAHVMDVLVDIEGEVTGGRVYGLPFNEGLMLNKLTVEEGRLPEASHEVVVERSDFVLLDVNIGDTIRISEENEAVEDTYTTTEFEVVGIVENPYYFQKQAETTTVGNGQLGTIIYGSSDIYDMTVFTDVFLTIKGAKDLDTFSDEYINFTIEPIVEEMEALGEERSQIRYDEMVQEAMDEIQQNRIDAEEEIEQNRVEAEEEIAETLELIELGVITDPAIINEIQSVQEEIDQQIQEAYADLDEEIQAAEEELDGLEEGQWYVLDRNANTSYVSFDLNSGKVDSVATVFPVFFYLVAALVSLTTMTRMVEEERIQIGTLKALGYSKITIISKYIIYSGLASVLGSVTGILLGMRILPLVIWNAFDSLFYLPEFITTFNAKIALIASGIAVVGNILVTIYVCNHILRENAASLMLPKAPSPGKRILLEHINFLWSRLSFNQKSTIRNVFRYKKHFFMTVIGISGCTALLITGFGLRDSIGDLANIQFNEIIGYDLVVNFEDDPEEIYEILDVAEVKDSVELHTDNGDITYASQTEDITIVAVDHLNDLDGFVDLRDRKSGDPLELDKDAGVVTEKIAEVYELELPETVDITNLDEEEGSIQVTHITENYAGNNIYMSHEKYEEIFDFDGGVENNTIYVSLHDEIEDATKDDLINELLRLDTVLSANLIDRNRDTFDDLLTNINYIVVIIILASGGLAFIVLYNLTNININERKKELATFRVLGFYNEEVASYIFRETAILTAFGVLVGLGLGTLLHQFVILTVEDPEFMFGRDIRLISYGLSALITVVFAFLVNIFMSKKIKNIKMADSMKAND